MSDDSGRLFLQGYCSMRFLQIFKGELLRGWPVYVAWCNSITGSSFDWNLVKKLVGYGLMEKKDLDEQLTDGLTTQNTTIGLMAETAERFIVKH